jgi:signal transduction histidine kinase
MPDYKIMIVEDEEIVAADIQESCEKMGYSVCAKAATGTEAVEKAKLTRPDLVLMDIVLKGHMDGIAAARQIKELYEIPVVYLTAFGDDSMVQQAKVAEPYGYITKPFRYRELQIAIEISIYKRQAEEEKAKLEAQNRQFQKSESLGRMAGAIVHHFNNMLQAIMGNIQMAMRIMPQNAGSIKNLTAAMEVAHTAEAISGQMLTYLGQSFDTHESLNLSEICRWSLPMLQTIIPGNVKLETDLPSPGPVISANANQIQQIMTILVTNAWEAVRESPSAIHLSVKTVSQADISASYRYPVDWQPQDNVYACLEVTDEGGGIESKDIEKIFDPFFSTKFTGRGMGLAVVLGIARAHGGGVVVESATGRGSIFRVYFPVSSE